MTKKLLAKMGLGFSKIFGKQESRRASPLEIERERFEKDARSQFIALKKKGLSIPVFTL